MHQVPLRSPAAAGRRRAAGLALVLTLSLGMASCSEGTAPPAGGPSSTETVVLVVVDGLRGNALQSMAALWSARVSATWTDSLSTVVPSVTFPGVLSILSGRDVTAAPYNVRGNDPAVAGNALLTTGLTTVMQWARAGRLNAGTAAVVGAQLAAFATPEAKLLLSLDEIVAVGTTDAEVMDAVLPLLARATPPAVVFVHLGGVDAAGHTHGWISSDTTGDAVTLTTQYTEAVARADVAIARLLDVAQSRIASGRVAVVITADHGGGHGFGEHCSNTEGEPARRSHCSAHPGDVLVPLVILAGPGRAAGRIPGRPSVTNVAATVARLLDVAPPPGAGAALTLGAP